MSRRIDQLNLSTFLLSSSAVLLSPTVFNFEESEEPVHSWRSALLFDMQHGTGVEVFGLFLLTSHDHVTTYNNFPPRRFIIPSHYHQHITRHKKPGTSAHYIWSIMVTLIHTTSPQLLVWWQVRCGIVALHSTRRFSPFFPPPFLFFSFNLLCHILCPSLSLPKQETLTRKKMAQHTNLISSSSAKSCGRKKGNLWVMVIMVVVLMAAGQVYRAGGILSYWNRGGRKSKGKITERTCRYRDRTQICIE